MEVAFDTNKDEANRAKHGVSLGFGTAVFGDPTVLVVSSIRLIDGEERFKAVGLVENRFWTAVYVRRGNITRFISVRRSNDGEERLYDRAQGGSERS